MGDGEMLTRFREEVMYSGPEGVLPCNLSDYWLDEVQRCIELCSDSVKEGAQEAPDNSILSVPLAAILQILFVKNGFKKIDISVEEIGSYLDEYGVELALESVRRKTDMAPEPATMETIFTNRAVTIQIPRKD